MLRRKKQLEEQYRVLEMKYDTMLAEKMELEYKCKSLEYDYQHEKKQSEEILRLHESARRLKHDMKNHIMVIAKFLQEGEMEQAKEYMSKIMDKLNQIYTYIETGNSLMSHILNEKFEQAHKQQIQIKAQIENLPFSKLDSVDFTSVLSNILDNAIEGASGEVPSIAVEIAQKRSYEMILVKNTIASSILEKNPSLVSSKGKDETHGYGIAQIKKITEKYGGLIDFYEEKGFFCVCVMFPV
jgi:sensor histidine kinase regulating citrate/malate metabolism